MNAMAFPEKYHEELHRALADAFKEDELRRLVRFDFQQDLDGITTETNYTHRTFQLVEWAIRHNHVEELFRFAFARNPTNPRLQALAALVAREAKNHRLNLVPSIWVATWTIEGQSKPDHLLMEAWTGDNSFSGHGLVEYAASDQPEIYNWSFKGDIEPVGVILLRWYAQGYPFEGAKNVGVAVLEIQDDDMLAGHFSGYKDKRTPAEKTEDRKTHPEITDEKDRFLIPLGRMTYYEGTVTMRRARHGQ
jgi:hypothetical protein